MKPKIHHRNDQLAPPMRLVPGECTTLPNGLRVCAPAQLAQMLSDLSFARAAANDARERNDSKTEQAWLAELRKTSDRIRAATEPQTYERKDSAMKTDAPTLRRFRRDKLRGPTSRPAPAQTAAERGDAADKRADAWRNQWRQLLRTRDDVLHLGAKR